jgi:leader peptidase (prepilin peptidase) / N-methyltransferase
MRGQVQGRVHILADSVSVLISIFTVLAGLALGSFLNVCITRLPRHESVVAPRSRCPRCLTPILNRDNVPLLSWMLLHGRCRSCGAQIPIRYPLVEAATATLFLLCYFEFGLTLGAVAAAVLCWLLLGLAATDAEMLLLPDALTLPGIAFGLLYSGFQKSGKLSQFNFSASNHSSVLDLSFAFSWKAAVESLIWAACAAILILLIRGLYWLARRREGIGLGDAKLLAMIAAWLGPWQTGLVLLLAAVCATAYGLALIVYRRLRGSAKNPLTVRIPLGAFLCAAGILAIFEGVFILSWYLGLFR